MRPFPLPLANSVPDRDDSAIRAVARSCGQLAVGCSDAAGYVAAVAHGITEQLTALTELEQVTSALDADQRAVAASTSEARRLSDQARATLSDEAAVIVASVGAFGELTDLITTLGTRVTGFAAAMEQVRRVSAAIDDIARKTNLLALNATIEAKRAGDAGRTFAVVAAEVKKLALETRQATDEIGRTMESLEREGDSIMREIDEGVGKSRSAQSGIARISDTVREVSDIVARVDEITGGIKRSTEVTTDSVSRVRDTLSLFGAEARDGGTRLANAHDRMSRLERQSNEMLDQLAHSGVRLDDTGFVDVAIAGMREVQALVEQGIARGEVAETDVFDTDYVPMPGTDPVQCANRFNAFADAYIRPVLDRRGATDARRILGVAVTDINGYLPTHMTSKSQPQRPGDPAWNAENCRNRRNFMDDATARAVAFEGDFMLVTYRQDLGHGRYRPVKSVFVPLWIGGRRWGNFEIAFVD